METERNKRALVVAKTWDNIWKKTKLGEWDKLSESIYQVLRRETLHKSGLMLEAGSGTGRISCRLKEDFAEAVVLLDVSKTAIKISKGLFEEKGQTGFFIIGSILDIPLKGDITEVSWNAGVLEHFSENEQSRALEEMLRVCKGKGLIVTLNPSSRALLYRIGKWFAEKTNAWTVGYEKPVKSMRKYIIKSCFWESEYSMDFDATIVFLSPIPFLNRSIALLHMMSVKLPAKIMDQFGYLLVSLARKVE